MFNCAPEAVPKTTGALAVPLQAIGKSGEHVAFPGTLSLSCETLVVSPIELGESVHRAGVCRIILLVSHGGQPHVMDIVACELRTRHAMLVANAAWFNMGMPDNMFSTIGFRHGIHRGRLNLADAAYSPRSRRREALRLRLAGNGS